MPATRRRTSESLGVVSSLLLRNEVLSCICAHAAVIYWVIGIPVAWILWYYRLYNAAKKDAAFTYAWFFLAYLVHIFWCIWSAVCAHSPASFTVHDAIARVHACPHRL